MNYKEIYGDYKIDFKQEIETSTISEIWNIKIEILENYLKNIFDANSEKELLNIINRELKKRKIKW